jgi:hypothetical protein
MFDLLYAAAVGDVPSVRHCIDRSEKANYLWGDLNRTCGLGRTPLHYAVLGAHQDVLEALLAAGARLIFRLAAFAAATVCMMPQPNTLQRSGPKHYVCVRMHVQSCTSQQLEAQVPGSMHRTTMALAA